MGITLKLRQFGNSASTIWPKDVLAAMNLKIGDTLSLIKTKDGWLVTPYDAELEETMRIAEDVADEYKDALRELSKR
jgi:putative addiction module antidote